MQRIRIHLGHVEDIVVIRMVPIAHLNVHQSTPLQKPVVLTDARTLKAQMLADQRVSWPAPFIVDVCHPDVQRVDRIPDPTDDRQPLVDHHVGDRELFGLPAIPNDDKVGHTTSPFVWAK